MTASEVVYTWIEYPKDITQPCFEGSVVIFYSYSA